jgi:hypothetical protein
VGEKEKVFSTCLKINLLGIAKSFNIFWPGWEEKIVFEHT